jgi:hypothetical protein
MGSPATATAERAQGDRGAALIEFALISPIFLIIVFAIFEFGLVYRDSLTISDAVNDAARTGAIAGNDLGALDDDPPPPSGDETPRINDATADFVTIKKMRQALGALPVGSVDRIVIFKAEDPTFGGVEEQLSEVCKTGPGTAGSGAPNYVGACNVYDDVEEAFRAYENKNIGYFSCIIDNASRECNWPGRVRNNSPINPILNHPGPDYLGVWVRINRPYITGIFGSDLEITDAAVVRLEPGLVEE